MGFRNIRAPDFGILQTADGGPPGTQVVTWINGGGQIEPLATFKAGGAMVSSATLAVSSFTQLLAAPPTNFGYRLQRFVLIDNTTVDLAASATGPWFGQVSGTSGTFKPVDDLEGLIVGSAVGALNVSGTQTGRVSLFYDLVRAPFIH